MAATTDGVAGQVLGTRLYDTRVSSRNGHVITHCTCPIEILCKHGIAMALRWVRSGVDRDPERATKPAGFASEKELVAWARSLHVEHALNLPARVADEYVHPQFRYELSYRVAHLTLGGLACAHASVPHHFAPAFAEAAVARLEAEARFVRDGLAEETERPRDAPSPEVEALWTRLIDLRDELRASVQPRGRDRRSSGTWRFLPNELQIAWHDPDYRHAFHTVRPVTLAFVDERPVLSCSCAAPDACTHQLALVDATLDVLADPERRALAIQVTKELTRPGWSRVLDTLEQVVTRTTKPQPSVEVWWQIERGAVDLVAIVRKPSKRGTLTSGARTAPERLLSDYADLDARDRAVAELLAAFHETGRRASYPHRALAALVGHPRVRDADGDPIVVRRATLGLAARRAGERIQLEPVIASPGFAGARNTPEGSAESIDGSSIAPARLAAILDSADRNEPLLAIDDAGCTLIAADEHVRAVCKRLLAHGASFPPEAHEALLDAITRLDGRMPVAITAELMGVEHAHAPMLVVRVRLASTPEDDTELALEALIRPTPGAPLLVPGEGQRDILVVRDGVRGYVRRQLGDERAWVRERLAVLPLGAAAEEAPGRYRITSLDAALDIVTALERPPEGIEAQWVDERPRVISRVGAKQLRIDIKRERDWFGIDGDVAVDKARLELAILLDAMLRQERYVRVGPGSWLELSEELRARLTPLADHTYASRDHLEVSLGAVPAIEALIEDGARIHAAPAWTLATDRLKAAQKLAPKPPKSLRQILRPYQAEGHAWLTRIAAWGAGACLADDMGIGKTLQAIAVLVDRAKLGPAIVLAPTSVTLNWVSELARFAPKLRPVLLTETADRTACLAELRTGDVLIVSYGLLVREIDRLAALKFATLFADEAQALKNAETQRAKAARRLDAELRVALTGTPLENHLGELWSIFSIVFPRLLGSWDQFRERFALPIERGGANTADEDARRAADHARISLARVLRPFLLRRTKAEVARELPPRTEIEIAIEMSPDERDLYEDARLAAVAALSRASSMRDEQRRFQVLAALTRLRLLACHPRLHDPTSHVPSSKLERLVALVEDLRESGHRALVFSQFTKHLALVRETLERAGITVAYLDGETPAKERARRIAAFQTGEHAAFLISLKAGGTGINLTAADYVIHLDPWWNPAVEDQATDRAHRIGQDKPVTVYRLITKDTVEEKILAMHGQKRRLVSEVLEGTGAASKLSTADLLALLSGSA
jgi:superfamily II DNA or RNA helicase